MCSKNSNNENVLNAAANAITILNGSLFSFSNLDFSNIQIPYANLRNSIMHNTDLTGANLTGVNFRNTYMVDANLSNCNLTDTQFGEYPSIKENTNLLRCVIFSNNGKYILGYGLDKKFVMWDANTFKLANTFIGHIKWI